MDSVLLTTQKRLSVIVLLVLMAGTMLFLAAQQSWAQAAGPVSDEATVPILTREMCIEMALSRNLSLAQSLVQIETRVAEIKEVRATVYPQVELAANYTRLGNLTKYDFGSDQKISFVPEDNYLFNLSLTQLLYSGGQVQAALRLAENARQAVIYEKQLTEETIIMLTSLYFNQVLLVNRLIAVAEETIANVTAHLSLVRLMKEQGLASEYDLLRAEVELANITPLLIQTRNQQRLAHARLENVIQWDGGDYEISGAFAADPVNIEEQKMLAQAYENRWELMIITTNRAMINETVNIAKGGYLPTLAFFGNYDWANDEIDMMTGDGKWNYGWNLGLQANWKLFDGFATEARVTKAEGNLKNLDYELEKTKNSIKLELTEAINNYREAYEILASQGKNVEQARKGLHIAEVRFRDGISNQLEVMDSSTALTRAQSQLALAEHNFAVARLMLDKATGTIRTQWLNTRADQSVDMTETQAGNEEELLTSEPDSVAVE